MFTRTLITVAAAALTAIVTVGSASAGQTCNGQTVSGGMTAPTLVGVELPRQ